MIPIHYFLIQNQFFLVAKSLIPTKWSLLQIAAKVFDPLGFISFFAITLKALFQDLCSKSSMEQATYR